MSGESSVRELRATGLQGVSLGETEIALVDGENGRLIYRGHDAERLAHESTFEATAYLLWNGRLPDDAELAELRQRAVSAMVVPSEVHDAIRSLGSVAPPMDVLRTGLSVWGALRGRDEGGDSEDALWALAATPAIVADYARASARGPIRSPRIPISGSSRTTCSSSAATARSGAGARSTRTSSSAPSTA